MTKNQATSQLEQPKKEDTLVEKAGKRSKRIITGKRLINFMPHWWIGTGEVVGLAAIIIVNIFLLIPFFGQEDISNVFSAPLIPVLANITSFYMLYDHGVRFWLLVFIIMLPISLYFLIREITNRRFVAFIASVIVSLPVGIFLPLRTKLGLTTQDGGHVASLTLTMFACLFLIRFLKGGKFVLGIYSAVLITLVALTSPLGLFILFCFALAIVFSEMLLSQGRIKIVRFILVFLIAAGFSAFWYHPKFLLQIFNTSQGEMFIKTINNLLPLGFFLAPILGAFGFLLFENRPQLQPLFLAVFFSIGFGLLSLGAGLGLSTPSRFMPSFGISIAFLAGLALSYLYDYLLKPKNILSNVGLFDRYQKYIATLTLVFLVLINIIVIDVSGRHFREESSQMVLGESIVKRTGIWEVREQNKGWGNAFGTGISIVTLFITIMLGIKLRKNRQH